MRRAKIYFAPCLAYGQNLLADLSHPVWFTLILAWLLLTILFSLFVVVRHVESLAVILPLAVNGLVLPNYTSSSPDQTFSSIQEAFLMIVSVALYGIFLTI